MKKILVGALALLMILTLPACNNQKGSQKVESKGIDAKVGEYIKFGSYEQDNDSSNGKEEIEWLVLDIKDGRALVISKYLLDSKPFNTDRNFVTWESCSLRQWLNNDFFNAAFSANEMAKISAVTVTADRNPDYNTNPGNATQDNLFLLSISEVEKYFASDGARLCDPTEYAASKSSWYDDYGSFWWLRTPGTDQSFAAIVSSRGDVSRFGNNVNGVKGIYAAIRPAMWIELD